MIVPINGTQIINVKSINFFFSGILEAIQLIVQINAATAIRNNIMNRKILAISANMTIFFKNLIIYFQ